MYFPLDFSRERWWTPWETDPSQSTRWLAGFKSPLKSKTLLICNIILRRKGRDCRKTKKDTNSGQLQVYLSKTLLLYIILISVIIDKKSQMVTVPSKHWKSSRIIILTYPTEYTEVTEAYKKMKILSNLLSHTVKHVYFLNQWTQFVCDTKTFNTK